MVNAAHGFLHGQGQSRTVSVTVTLLQFGAILCASLVAGSTFGIWRGYDPSAYSATTFLEVHQGAVKGLNLLLPLLGATSLATIAALAFRSRGHPPVLALYVASFVILAAGGFAVTRFINQPINAQIMNWTASTMPADWVSLRDEWWRWHVIRTAAAVLGAALLIVAVFADRDAKRKLAAA